MTKKLVLTVGVFMVMGFVASAIYGQSKDDGDRGSQVQYKKKTVYDFDDDVVEGELQRPEGDVLTESARSRHSSLITVRQHFIPEMIKTAENI